MIDENMKNIGAHTAQDKEQAYASGVPAQVADVMTTEVITLHPNRSFAEAVSLMANHHFHHFLVADNAGRIAGVISDRDILRALARTGDWQAKKIGEIMTHAPITVSPTTSLCSAVGTMLSNRINCLPVVNEDGTICGILTSTDLLRSYEKYLQSMAKDAARELSHER